MKRLPHDQRMELAAIMNFIRYIQTEKDMCTFFHIWIICYTRAMLYTRVLCGPFFITVKMAENLLQEKYVRREFLIPVKMAESLVGYALFLHTRQGFRHFRWYKTFPSYTRGYKTTLIMWLYIRAPVSKDIGHLLVSFCALLALQSECSLFRAHAVR